MRYADDGKANAGRGTLRFRGLEEDDSEPGSRCCGWGSPTMCSPQQQKNNERGEEHHGSRCHRVASAMLNVQKLPRANDSSPLYALCPPERTWWYAVLLLCRYAVYTRCSVSFRPFAISLPWFYLTAYFLPLATSRNNLTSKNTLQPREKERKSLIFQK